MVQSTSAPQVEELHPGLTFQWILDRRGIAFYAENSTRGLVDAWADKLIEIAKAWPRNLPLVVLNDFSGKDCAVTPYNQQRNRELLKMFPDLRIVTAIVVKQSLTMHMSRLFIRVIPKSKADVYLTFSRHEGLAWLKKRLDQ
jgi:hypothetical protein